MGQYQHTPCQYRASHTACVGQYQVATLEAVLLMEIPDLHTLCQQAQSGAAKSKAFPVHMELGMRANAFDLAAV
eukprot:1616934-Rhodomonas_salina.1